MKKSCQDLEKNLGKIFSRSCKNLARNQAIQDFRMDFGTRILQDKKDSCKFEKLAWIWNRFLANLPNLETSWQDLARYFLIGDSGGTCTHMYISANIIGKIFCIVRNQLIKPTHVIQ